MAGRCEGNACRQAESDSFKGVGLEETWRELRSGGGV
jgi:hypothetical protein